MSHTSSLVLFTNNNMQVSKLKWILLVLFFITFISNAYGRRGGGSSSSSSRGSSSSSRGSSSSSRGSSGSSAKASSSSSGGKSSASSGRKAGKGTHAGGNSYSSRRWQSSRRGDSYYGSGKNDYQDSDEPRYTVDPKIQDLLRPKYVPEIKPYTMKYPDFRFDSIPTFKPLASGASNRKSPLEDKVKNDFYARLPDFKHGDKVITSKQFFENPEYSKDMWKNELIPKEPEESKSFFNTDNYRVPSRPYGRRRWN